MRENQGLISKFKECSEVDNHIEITLFAISKNEKLARNVVASCLIELNPSVEELSDIKTAVSEAVTNSVVHGYLNKGGKITIDVKIKGYLVYIKIADNGVGIKNIEEARQPFFTTGNMGERSGMGFTVMETFMDEVNVSNQENGSGLVVELLKELTKERD